MNKRMLIMLGLALVLFGGIFGYKSFVNRMIQDAFNSMGPETVTITSSTARLVQWVPQLEVVGTFQALQGADLSLEVGGLVRDISFENGQRVEAGQKLLSLDTEVVQAELEQFEATLRLAEMELERQQSLYAQRSISEAVLDRAMTEVDQARAAVAARQAMMSQRILRAPFSGRLGIRQVNPGQFLSPGTPVVSLQSLDPIYFEFTVPQRQLRQISVGAALNARSDAFPDIGFAGQINAIEPRINESTRSARVQATFENADQVLQPGMFAHADIDLGEPTRHLVVPRTAIRASTYGDSVFVIEDAEDGDGLRVSQRFVQTGLSRGDLITVVDGLEDGDRVASSGLLKLRNGTPVRIDDDPSVQPDENPNPRPQNS
jgi:membrane fusion protein (multidrug efflux system)